MTKNREQYLEEYYIKLMEEYNEDGEYDNPESLYDLEIYETLQSVILGGPWLWLPPSKEKAIEFSKGYKPFSDEDIKDYKYPGIVGRDISIDTIATKESCFKWIKIIH